MLMGMSLQEFDLLLTKMEKAYPEEERKRLSKRSRQREIGAGRRFALALVDFGDQITKIYHQGASMAQITFEQPCGGHHIFEHRDEMRRDRIWRRS